MSPEPHPYSRLTPDLVLDAIERFGFRCTGALLPLSSYENRVYLAETEDSDGVVAKFYRPERWSDAAIVEEHAFALELAAREIPVVAPLPLEEGKGATSGAHGPTLVEHGGFRVAVYPRQRGHFPELDDPQTLEWVGRFLGRIHAVAATASFIHRPMVSMERLGYEPLEYLRGSEMVPHEARGRYAAAAERLLAAIAGRMDAIGPVRRQRLHGDCHAGNVLWTESGPFFVDLDDCCTGPTVQDLWMLLSGERWEMEAQLAHILRGYRQFHTFEAHELALIEPLRGLRAVHYAAWLARRWADPAFPKAFPWFGTHRYWEDQCVQLDEQLERLDLVIDAQ